MVDIEDRVNKLPERMLRVKEVASILNIHPNTVRRWEKIGLLKSRRIGSHRILMFSQENIVDFLDKAKNGVHVADS